LVTVAKGGGHCCNLILVHIFLQGGDSFPIDLADFYGVRVSKPNSMQCE